MKAGARVTINCDGAARGNPGPAGAGAVVVAEDGTVLAEIAEGLGETTNNVAEYTAVVRGLEAAQQLGARDVLLRSDSQLLINQLTGKYRVKAPHLQPLHRRVLDLMKTFERVELEHVPRERNAAADHLANVGVDRWLAEGRA
ncbi:MAG: ribonuclease HI family protein [Actinomycetota bacterium]